MVFLFRYAKLSLAASGFIELCVLFPSIRWRLFTNDVAEEGKADVL
jgi:hypothetical protein